MVYAALMLLPAMEASCGLLCLSFLFSLAFSSLKSLMAKMSFYEKDI